MTSTTSKSILAPHPAQQSAPLLEVRDLAVSFASRNRSAQRTQAIDGVSLTIYPCQTLAVVGESGCGKTVTALTALRLIPCPPGHIDRGSIMFEGRNLLECSGKQMREIRGGEIAMIFQEPMTSLNPVFTVGQQIVEAIMLHQRANRKQALELAIKAMNEVGIPRAAQRINAYPHQFSGGMRQRVMIAMALACRPKLLLADEPTTALDVTIQAQILELLRELQRQRGLGVMLITHDLGVVAQHADVVCVMYAGRVVEYASVWDLFDRPLHPYTRALFKSRPRLGSHAHRLATVTELLSDPAAFAPLTLRGSDGGEFRPWWPGQRDAARTGDRYALCEVEPSHWMACWRSEADATSCRPPDIPPQKIRGS